MDNKKYRIELFYGWTESDEGCVYHTFEPMPANNEMGDDLIEYILGERLDCTKEDMEAGRFSVSSMYLDLPDEVVAQIQADAVQAYKDELRKSS